MSASAGATWRRDLLLLSLLAASVVLPGLGARDLWNPDEPRYAEVAREMRESGEYLVPHFNGRLYTQKPPLMFWAMSAAAMLRGELDETAARLPSALAAIGSVLLVYALGRRLFDRRAAWIAAAVFLTNWKILWQARVGQIDMLLTFLVLCAVFSWVVGWLEDRPALSYLFFAFAGLATLAKGPVGLLPPLLSLLAFIAITRDRAALRSLHLGRGLLLWAGIVLLWLGPAILSAGAAYRDEMLIGQNVTRYVAPSGHHQPIWYFLGVLPVDFLPWSLFLPTALVAVRTLDQRQRRHALLMLCWAVTTIAFFSLSPGKRTVYILTMYPALAVLIGAGLAALSRAAERSRGWVAWPAGALALLFSIVAVAVPIAARRPDAPAFAPLLVTPVALAMGAIAASMTAALVLALRRHVTAAVGAVAVGLAGTTTFLFVSVLPRLDPELSHRELAERIRRDLPDGFELASWREMEGGLLFYGSPYARELRNEEELSAYLRDSPPAWLVVDPDDPPFEPRAGLEVIVRQGRREDGVMIFAPSPGVVTGAGADRSEGQ